MFWDINISQGSVATPLGCGVICNDLFIANFLLSVTVKDCSKDSHNIMYRCLVDRLCKMCSRDQHSQEFVSGQHGRGQTWPPSEQLPTATPKTRTSARNNSSSPDLLSSTTSSVYFLLTSGWLLTTCMSHHWRLIHSLILYYFLSACVCVHACLLSPPSEWSEWRRKCVCLMCVCVCVCVQRTGQSDQFKMFRATIFKFHVHVPGDSPDMTPYNFLEKGAWSGSHDPQNLWALNVNSSKKVKATDFKFPGQSVHDPLKNFSKGAWPGSRDR